ncbi:restriction endonuclease [Streptomyces sp. XH2]|uniref:restriction endonuclease n=1 Tax=Streptomyces sp. XH2 TaxID=3412483 RepID=UPI003C7E6F4B
MVSRRRPVRRRRSRRQQQADVRAVLFVVAGVAAVGLVVTLVRWLAVHWWVGLIGAVLAAAAGGAELRRRQQRAQEERLRAGALRYAISQLDSLDPTQFEHAIRDLMYRDGCADARQVGGRGDNGADVKATDPFGRLWVIQCKHRRQGDRGSAVGTPDLHVVAGTARPLHGADVAVMVTNGRFSSRCPPLARTQRIHLVDRRVLGEWAAGGRPLWEVLRALPPPRRPSSLR